MAVSRNEVVVIENVVRVEMRSVYGRWTAYPSNHVAKMFAAIAGTKSLTRDVLLIVSASGYDVSSVNGVDWRLVGELG